MGSDCISSWSLLIFFLCICENGIQVWTSWVELSERGMHVWAGYTTTRCEPISTCKMFARLWMRYTDENEVCTCEPANRVRSCSRNALLWMECMCVNGTGETNKCVRICETRAHLWMEMRICEWGARNLEPGHLSANRTSKMWMGPYLWTGPLTYERDHSLLDETRRLHVEDHGQPIPNLWTESLRVTGSSTCERDMYVWTGPVFVKDPPRVNEKSTCQWNEMSMCEWNSDKRLKFRRWFLHDLTRHKENYTCLWN